MPVNISDNAMCGRFNVFDSPEVQLLLKLLAVEGAQLRYSGDMAPGATISIIRQSEQGRQVCDAIWWLMLDRQTLKPNYDYASFNSRWDKLNTKGSLAYQPYRQGRCVIPASAFIEGLGDRRTYHQIELQNEAIAFGGLYKHYLDPHTGESIYTASIITLGPLPQWQHIHPKSMPLMLPAQDTALINNWLDPKQQDVSQFESLLKPHIRSPQRVTPIGKPSQWNPIGESFMLDPEPRSAEQSE
ncbi:MAG: SOS response-associated peptidase family protein [Pseudohongiella sp.]|nr:SOS response-associated peptidase family protein [Pseudohongiella sp.]